MSGKKGRSGRRPSAATLERLSLQENEQRVPEYLKILREIAEDRGIPFNIRIQAYEYLINRSEGTPKSTYDLRFSKDSAGLSAEDYRKVGGLSNLVMNEQVRKIEELFGAPPALSVREANQLIPVQNIWIDIDQNQVEAEFNINGTIERKVL